MSFKEVLSDRSVRRLWIAQLISVFGDFLALFAVFSLVTFQLHGTPTQVAMILVSFLLPLAFISPIAGVFVDKWNVKWTMILSDVVRGILILVLVFVRDLNAIYVIFFCLATVSSFFIPAQSVAVPDPCAGRRTDGGQRADVAGDPGLADHRPFVLRHIRGMVRRQCLLPGRRDQLLRLRGPGRDA